MALALTASLKFQSLEGERCSQFPFSVLDFVACHVPDSKTSTRSNPQEAFFTP